LFQIGSFAPTKSAREDKRQDGAELFKFPDFRTDGGSSLKNERRIAMLSVNNISMRYGATLLFEDVTCTFFAGRRYAITGPNGAGKSTFMRRNSG